MEDKEMSLQLKEKGKVWQVLYGLVIIFAVTLISFGSYQRADAQQKTFKTPEEAVTSLMEAVKANDTKAMLAIFGPEGKEIGSSPDKVQDKAEKERFVKAYEAKNKLEKETDSKMTLVVGEEEWPFSIPIVKRGEGWVFDTKTGREEMLNRRIGRNELSTIRVCLGYVEAQREYAITDREQDGIIQYAQKFASDKYRRNGLYWEATEGEVPSPLGPFAVKAAAEGYRRAGDKPMPYHGYYFKILKGQGKMLRGELSIT